MQIYYANKDIAFTCELNGVAFISCGGFYDTNIYLHLTSLYIMHFQSINTDNLIQ